MEEGSGLKEGIKTEENQYGKAHRHICSDHSAPGWFCDRTERADNKTDGKYRSYQ